MADEDPSWTVIFMGQMMALVANESGDPINVAALHAFTGNSLIHSQKQSEMMSSSMHHLDVPYWWACHASMHALHASISLEHTYAMGLVLSIRCFSIAAVIAHVRTCIYIYMGRTCNAGQR